MAVEAPPAIGEAEVALTSRPSGARRRDSARSWAHGIWCALALL